jgi:hypothetical protein
VAPGSAVVEAFGRVERELRRIALGPPPVEDPQRLDRMSVRSLAVLAGRQGRISEESANAISGLTVLRNLAAHGRSDEIDTPRAVDFLHLVDAVLYALGNETRS